MAKLTLYGMSKYHPLNQTNNDLFDGLILPADIDRELVIKNMLVKGGEYEVVYSDWNFLQMQIGLIASKWYHTFEEWLKAQRAEYNPIENYDRYEEITEGEHSNGSASAVDTMNSNGSSNSASNKSSFDSDRMTPYTTDTNSSGSSTQGTTSSNSETSTDRTHTAHLHGNIGVTTAPQMLKEFYEISSWNLIEHITDVFLSEIVIPIV